MAGDAIQAVAGVAAKAASLLAVRLGGDGRPWGLGLLETGAGGHVGISPPRNLIRPSRKMRAVFGS